MSMDIVQPLPPAPTSSRPKAIPANLCVAESLDDFECLHDPRINILMFPFQPSHRLRELCTQTEEAELPEKRLEFCPIRLSGLIEDASSPLEYLLLSELEPIIRRFMELARENRFEIRLQAPKDQMCPLFHVDQIAMRLLITLRGPGTQWLADGDVWRKGLGKGRNDKVLKDGARIRKLEPFQVGILKGDMFPTHYRRGLVHRSPSLPTDGSCRYLLKIDCKHHGCC